MITILAVLAGLPLLLFVVLQSSTFQTWATQRAANWFSEKYSHTIEIGSIDISLFSAVELKNIYVSDQNRDTLFYMPLLDVKVDEFSIMNNQIFLDKVIIDGVCVYIREDETGTTNLQFLLDALASSDTTQVDDTEAKPWDVRCSQFEFVNTSFRYSVSDAKTAKGMNFSDLDFRNFDLFISDFSLGDTMKLNINSLSLSEKSGFELHRFAAETRFSDKGILLDNFVLQAPHTNLRAKILHFTYDDFSSFSDFVNKVHLRTEINDSSYISTSDLAYILPAIDSMDVDVGLSGNLRGTINSLRTDNLRLQLGDETEITTQFAIDSITNFDKANIDFEVKQLVINKNDLLLIPIPPFSEQKPIQLPKEIDMLGTLRFTGIFKGSPNDFIANGDLETAMGTLRTNFQMETDTTTKTQKFGGKIRMLDFDAGTIADASNNIGRLSLNIDISGQKIGEKIDAKVVGVIDTVQLMGFVYKDIAIDASYLNDKLALNLNINDPKFTLEDFSVWADLSGSKYKYGLSGKIVNAYLHRFGVFTAHQMARVSLAFDLNGAGNEPDSIDAKLVLKDIYYANRYPVETIHVRDFDLNIESSKTKLITLNSDIIDANISGTINYETIVSSFTNVLYHYLPSLDMDDSWQIAKNTIVDVRNSMKKGRRKKKSYKQTNKLQDDNNFSYDFNIKQIDQINEIFLTEFNASSNTRLSGKLDAKNNHLSVEIIADSLKIADTKLKDTYFVIDVSEDSKLLMTLASKSVFFSETTSLDDFIFDGWIRKDTIDYKIKWNNWGEISYSGDIKAYTTLRKQNFGMLGVDMVFRKSNITIADIAWEISQSSINLDSTTIKINNIDISNGEQKILINGLISENKTDNLLVELEKINLNNLNILTSDMGVLFSGVLSGKTYLSNLLDRPHFTSSDSIVDFIINEQKFGNLYLNSNMDTLKNTVFAHLYTQQRNLRMIDIAGDIDTEDNILDFDIDIKKMRVSMFNKFTDGILSNLRGALSGKFAIEGKVAEPEISGVLKMNRVGFIVDYTKTKYDFHSEIIIIKPDTIMFEDMKIVSGAGEHAIINGLITHKKFADINFGVQITANNFKFLGTTLKDNPTFYGDVYTSGIINISGDPDMIDIKADINTNNGTRVFVPFETEANVDEHDFISFTKPIEFDEYNSEKYNVSVSGINLLLNLGITPDAELQMIMDAKTGDILKAKGEGQIQVAMPPTGDMSLSGKYTIVKGLYTFNLQGLLSKKFEITPGGNITWAGDPLDARLDLEAVYQLKKLPIYDLVLEDEFKEVRVPATCNLNIDGKLSSPIIGLGVAVQNIDQKIISQVAALPEDELNKQFLSLLIMNRFQPLPGLKVEKGTGTGVGINTTEVLTSQLSHWLSQISEELDVGVNYRPGDELSTDQVELALSTTIMNDRIKINSNVGVGGQSTVTQPGNKNTSNIVGDIEIEYKLTKNGNVLLKVFNRINNNVLDNSDTYSQGLGAFYRENFTEWKESNIGKTFNKFKNLFKKNE